MNVRLLAVLGLVSLFLLPGCPDNSTTVKGTGGKELTLTTPESFSIRRGETRAMIVDIDRANFSAPVEVSIAQLPDGVKVDNASKEVETTAATFMVTAEEDAPLVKGQAVKINVAGPEGMAVSRYIDMTVRD